MRGRSNCIQGPSAINQRHQFVSKSIKIHQNQWRSNEIYRNSPKSIKPPIKAIKANLNSDEIWLLYCIQSPFAINKNQGQFANINWSLSKSSEIYENRSNSINPWINQWINQSPMYSFARSPFQKNRQENASAEQTHFRNLIKANVISTCWPPKSLLKFDVCFSDRRNKNRIWRR